MRVESVLDSLGTSGIGLNDEEAEHRLETYGLNELREEKRTTLARMFLSQFTSILVIILIVSAIVSAYISLRQDEPFTDTYIILAIVFMNAVLGLVQEYRAEKALEALKRMVAPQVIVFRKGHEQTLESKRLVPGDIVLLDAGSRVPADARLLEAANLHVDEAALTGESRPVAKRECVLSPDTGVSDRINMIFMGTAISSGRAVAVVTETGMSTEFGKIAGLVQSVEEETPPLRKKVEKMGRQLGTIAVILTVWVFVLGLIVHQTDLETLFLTSVSMAVSAIPEGLPAVLTITLALGVGRMARQKAIVRKLASVETLGSTTVICSDKTGTLTKNEMTVSRISYNGRIINVTGSGYTPKGEFILEDETLDPQADGDLALLLRVGALCNDAHLYENDRSWGIFGDPTEGALVVAAAKAGLSKEDLEKGFPRVGEIPFDSGRKRMSTVHATSGGGREAYVKGAPEIVLERSMNIHENGTIRQMSKEDREWILSTMKEMASDALRVLAMAYREVPPDLDEFEPEEFEAGLTFVGLVGMIDPPREEVPDAIDLCRRAGIRSVMVTGDHRITAVAIAKQIRMLHEEKPHSVFTGEELGKMGDDEIDEVIDEARVFARVSPEHKVKIAQSLRRRGHVVAMTGDGVNDAPAIKTADIGIAMGIKGTDVTKEASDMVLQDDNFATIVRAVEGGRHIYNNITKYIRLMIAANFDEFMEISIAFFLGIPPPFLAIHVLWVNLVTDGLPAVALSIDPKEPDLMMYPPREPKEGILTRFWRFILFAAAVDFLSDFVPYVYIFSTTGDVVLARSVAFTTIVFFEFSLAYQCRSETRHIFNLGWKGFIANKMLMVAVVVGVGLQFAILYWPPLQELFHVKALDPYMLALCAIGSSTAFLIMPGKLIKRRSYVSAK